jgi:hypothetical protein
MRPRGGTIKTVTVLGTLNAESEGENGIHPHAVFAATGSGGAEITIRGRAGARGTERGDFTGPAGPAAKIDLFGPSDITSNWPG